MKMKILLFVLFTSTFVLPNSTMAQVIDDYRSNVAPQGQWTTIASWERYDGASWIPAVATPTSSTANVITIQTGDSITLTGPGITIDQIVIETGAALTIFNGSATTYTINNGTGDDIVVNGRLRIAVAGTTVSGTGTIQINSSGNFVFDISAKVSVAVTNDGTADLANTAILVGATFTNNGTLNLNSGNINLDNSNIINNGILSINTPAGSSNINNTAGTNSFVNNSMGNLRIITSGVSSTIFVPFTNSGVISGVGTFSMSTVTSNTGTIRPGSSPGILTINPTLMQGTGTTYLAEILDNTGSGTGNDQLTVNAAINLTGVTFTVSEIAPLATPIPPGFTYTIFNSTGALTGTPTYNLPSNYILVLTPANTIQVQKIALFPLPAIWGEFNAISKNNNQVKLNWSTLQENNVSSFAIEYSTNGVDFSPIGTVAANGTTNDVSEYSFIHLNPNVQKTNFYRIKQIDFDNKSALSVIRNVKFNKGSVVQVSVYPNPVKDKLQVSIQSDNIRLQLADMNGRIIKDQVLQVGNHEWSLRDYSPGIYMLSVLQNNQRIETIKIIKQ